MSRQYDEYMSNKFELYGDEYSLVEPESFDELMKAIKIRDLIQQGIDSMMHDEDSSGYCNLLQEQEDYIQGYLDMIGEFDNGHLISNISYLAKKNSLRLGDLEKMLGISAGYISRTARENTNKKMSIDIVWKLARLFNVDFKAMVETDLGVPNSNTEMLAKFIDKLYQQTVENSIEWESNGGVLRFLQEGFTALGLITEEDDVAVYHPDHLNQDLKWVLSDDVFACRSIHKDKQLVMIPFHTEKFEKLFYDFIFMWTTENKATPGSVRYHWEKAFYTADDRYGELETHAEALYNAIQAQDCDAKVPPTSKSIISDYLK